MEVEVGQQWFIPIIDKQFEMLGVALRFKDIPEDGLITVGKKKDYWYNIYKFTEEQEKEWRDWALKECIKKKSEDVFMYIDMRFGLVRSYPKKGELF